MFMIVDVWCAWRRIKIPKMIGIGNEKWEWELRMATEAEMTLTFRGERWATINDYDATASPSLHLQSARSISAYTTLALAWTEKDKVKKKRWLTASLQIDRRGVHTGAQRLLQGKKNKKVMHEILYFEKIASIFKSKNGRNLCVYVLRFKKEECEKWRGVR